VHLENITNQGFAPFIRMGTDSSGNPSAANEATVNVSFYNVSGQAGGAGIGPTCQFGTNTFFNTAKYIVCNSNNSAAAGSDFAQGILLGNPKSSLGGFQIVLEDVFITGPQGQMKVYGLSGGETNLYVKNLWSEGNASGHGIVWIPTCGGGSIELHSVQVSDNSGFSPGLENDCGMNVIAENVTGISGSAIMLGQGTGYPLSLEGRTATSYSDPAAQGQVGFYGGKVYGQIDQARRDFGPVAVRFTNLAVCCSLHGSQGSLTTGVTAPDGTTGAQTITNGTGTQVAAVFYNQNKKVAVGDYIIVGAWGRSRSGGWSGGGFMGLQFLTAGFRFLPVSGLGTASTSQLFSGPVVQGSPCKNGKPPCTWIWESGAAKVAAIGTNPANILFHGYGDLNHPTDYYGPVLLYIPVGTIDDNEAAEIASNLQSYGSSCEVGTICGLPGRTLSETFLIPNNGATFVNGNVILSAGWGKSAAVSAARGSAQRFTFTATASGTGISANPKMEITFPNAWPVTPIFSCKQVGGTGALTTISGENTANKTTMTLVFNGSPAQSSSYIFVCEGE
jgi:hypothetical protein